MGAALVFDEAQLMSEHPYARPLEAVGHRLHGGFDATGAYQSPRTLGRWPAVRGWQQALAARGWPLIDASGALLTLGNYPSFEQQRLLLQWGCGQTLWNSLTVTGVVEAGDTQIAIRGINGARDGENNVALVVDGVLKSNTALLAQDQGALKQIEILKGPQGAYYGRSAVAGAIVIATKKPGDKLEVSGRLSGANNNTFAGGVALNGEERYLCEVGVYAVRRQRPIWGALRWPHRVSTDTRSRPHHLRLRREALLQMAPAAGDGREWQRRRAV
jgi:hypothetical protein